MACVVHLHTDAGMAVAALECGLLPLNQISMQFYNRVSYHDYEGISLDLDECSRIVQQGGEPGIAPLGPPLVAAFVVT